MKILKTAAESLLIWFGITLLYFIINNSQIFSWSLMKTLWLFYPGFCGFGFAYSYACHYNLLGGGLFFSFCLIIPPVLTSYYVSMPWGDIFFHPTPIIIAGILSAIGEAVPRVLTKRKTRGEKV